MKCTVFSAGLALLFAAGTAHAALPDTAYKSGFEMCMAPAHYCADVDHDNYGDDGYCIDTCEPPYDFFALPGGDCDNDSAQIHPGAAEVCDGIDNNCSGVADEGNPGGGAACNTGLLGVCAGGLTQCSGGGLMCQQTVQASAETCDGQDNNCNGSVDEGNPGGGAACSTGLLGACAAGHTQCSGGGFVCAQNMQPSAEVCDGQDNNCNGQVDENNPGGGVACSTGLLGVCAAGTKSCSNGALVCNQSVQPSAESCDGKDNNCDGNVDEGNPGGGAPCDTGVPGVCRMGTVTCEGGVLKCKANAPGC